MRRKILFWGLGFLGLGLFAYVLAIAGPGDVLKNIRAIGIKGFAAAAAVVSFSVLSWNLSWQSLLRAFGARVPWGRTLGAIVAGFAISYITPSAYMGGEPVRVMLVSSSTVPATMVTATVIVERMLGTLSMLIFASLGGFFVLLSPKVPLFDKKVLVVGLGILFLSVLVAFFLLARKVRVVSRLFGRLGKSFPRVRFFGRAERALREVEDSAALLFNRPMYTLLALVFQTMGAFCYYIRPQVFFGVGLGEWFTFPQLSIYYSLNAVLSAFFWITPAGMGIAEGGKLGILRMVGIGADKALAYILVFRFLELLEVGCGIYYLLQRGLDVLGRQRISPLKALAPEDGGEKEAWRGSPPRPPEAQEVGRQRTREDREKRQP